MLERRCTHCEIRHSKIPDLGWKSSMNSVEAIRKSVKEMHENLDNIIKDD